MISDNTYKKFIETFDVSDWQIETDTGWSDIKEIGKTIEYDEWVLKTEKTHLICADKHIVFDGDMNEVFVKDLKINDFITTKNGKEKIIDIYKSNKKSNMYDLSLSNNSNHRYYTNDILSHNSMWLQNIGAKLADEGKNVVIITLEMAKYKVMKRLGSMRFRINVNDYDDVSKDSIFIKNKINELKSVSPSNELFDGGKAGKIFVKKYPTSDCTVTDLENFIKKFEEQKKIKIDAMIIDYINLMSIEKGFNLDTMLYLKGKHIAEGLRRLADKYDICMITATQTDKSVWGANDINLDDIPESKAIAESADSVWAIIRNPQMKKENTYKLKILKLRDGEHHEEQIKFDFNTKFLTMENDILIGSK